MRHVLLAFPAGPTGAAALLLRLSVAAFLILFAIGGQATHPWRALGLLIIALAMAVGYQVRIVAGPVAALALGMLIIRGFVGPLPSLMLLLDATALMLLGPGAYSIDGRRFGRRTLRLPG